MSGSNKSATTKEAVMSMVNLLGGGDNSELFQQLGEVNKRLTAKGDKLNEVGEEVVKTKEELNTTKEEISNTKKQIHDAVTANTILNSDLVRLRSMNNDMRREMRAAYNRNASIDDDRKKYRKDLLENLIHRSKLIQGDLDDVGQPVGRQP